MSDLSWLNPTPHAIAVYASRPLSPVAAQHSLPSGRYSLLGPDFHRLDRTSLRLAHSFDHLVGGDEQSIWYLEAKRLRGLEVDHELELGRQHNRQINRLLGFEDASGINAGLTVCIDNAGRVAHQAAGLNELAIRGNRRERVAGCQRDNPFPLGGHEPADAHVHRASP